MPVSDSPPTKPNQVIAIQEIGHNFDKLAMNAHCQIGPVAQDPGELENCQ